MVPLRTLSWSTNCQWAAVCIQGNNPVLYYIRTYYVCISVLFNCPVRILQNNVMYSLDYNSAILYIFYIAACPVAIKGNKTHAETTALEWTQITLGLLQHVLVGLRQIHLSHHHFFMIFWLWSNPKQLTIMVWRPAILFVKSSAHDRRW